MHGCCDYESDGQRCHFAGVFNTSTTGGGRWLCREHDRCKDHQTGADIVTASIRANPYPDFSLAARKQASEEKAAKERPRDPYGEADCRPIAKAELEKLARGKAGKPAPNPRQSSNQPAREAP
jgi:hypothetical protein